jgi:fructokinase
MSNTMAGAGSTHDEDAQHPVPLVVSFGELLWDLYPDGARLGGASANVAYHAAQLGCRSLLVSRVGRDALGESALASLGRAGVDVSGVNIDAQSPTGHVHVTFEGGEPRFRIGEGVAWDRIVCPESLLARLERSNVFCFGTLAQRTPLVQGELARVLRRIGALGRADLGPGERAGISRPLRLLDLNLRPPHDDPALLVDSVNLADVVKLNDHELERCKALCRPLGADDPIAWMLEQSVLLVAVTRGARGATLFTRNVVVTQDAFPSSGSDPVGAGDAFTAVLAQGLAEGKSLPEIAERACHYAAWVAEQPGAQPPDARRRRAWDESTSRRS